MSFVSKEFIPQLNEEEMAAKNMRIGKRLGGQALALEAWPRLPEHNRLYVVTWNLKGGIPPVDEVKVLFPDRLDADLVVVSTQQCERSLALSFFCEGKQRWQEMLADCLRSYSVVDSLTLQGLHTMIFVRKGMEKLVRTSAHMRKKVGCCGLTGNKGGVQILVDVGGKLFSFLNLHLQHGDGQHLTRVQQLSIILDQCHQRADYFIIAGDFNFRTDLLKEEAFQLTKKGKFVMLLSNDESRRLKLSKEGFREGSIQFPPSYKLQVGSLDYDSERAPSWTDRIIYKESDSMEQLAYNAALSKGSDHLPIYSQFIWRAALREPTAPPLEGGCSIF